MSGSLQQAPTFVKLRTGSVTLRPGSGLLSSTRQRSPSIGSTRSQLTSVGGSVFNLELDSDDNDGLFLYGEGMHERVTVMREDPTRHRTTLLIDIMSAEITEDRPLDVSVFPKGLQTLSVCSCNLTAVTGCIVNLPELQYILRLSLNANKLTSAAIEESGIDQLQSLQELNLSYNDMEWLPECVTKIDGLQNLSLAHNKLEEIPESMEKLVCLECLSLNNNQLTALCNGILSMNFLKFLDISQNPKMTYKPSELDFVKTQASVYSDFKTGYRSSSEGGKEKQDAPRVQKNNTLYRNRDAKEMASMVRTLRISKRSGGEKVLERLEQSHSMRQRGGVGKGEAQERLNKRTGSPNPSPHTLKTSSSSRIGGSDSSLSGSKGSAGDITASQFFNAPDSSSSSEDEEGTNRGL